MFGKLLKLTLGVTLLSAWLVADVNKGEKIYIKKLYSTCGFSGARFAMSHTQDEWESIKQAGKFSQEVLKICPKAKDTWKQSFEKDLYDFVYEYAKDSGKVPSCG